MKIAVLLKQVPDTESKIRIKNDGQGIETGDLKYIVNPYDEFAIEEALKTKEKIHGSETCVVSLGPDRTVEALRTALAMGIEKGIHINDSKEGLDNFSTALILSKVIKNNNFDVIFCGKQAIDDDSAQVPQMIAEFLGISQVMVIDEFKLREDQSGAQVTRRVSGGSKEIYEVTFPVILGCDKGLNTPRYASLPGIMKAKTKPVEKLNASDLLEGQLPLVQFINYQLPPERKSGQMIAGEPSQQAKDLVKLLREEAKII